MNLFLTEDGVLKLGYYGLTTQAECYSIKEMKCDGVRSFAPEVFEGKYEMKSDVWSLGIALIEMMGILLYPGYENNSLSARNGCADIPFGAFEINSGYLNCFLEGLFVKRVNDRWGMDELLNVSVMGWRMIVSIHSLKNMKKKRTKC